MLNALTIDVEDYFQVNAFASLIRIDEWDGFPLRVETNTRRVLDILDEFSCRATFFVLGWVAKRCPSLIREIHRRGHEIGCHSYHHRLVYSLSPNEFRQDTVAAKALLEDLCGEKVHGYRAPSYSITKQSLWALDVLAEEGFSYDSSIFPIIHDVYGIPGAQRFPHPVQTKGRIIQEFPISTLPLQLAGWHHRLPLTGGGYLRLLPVSIVSSGIRHINAQERQPVIVYFHPWEIDPDQPRINAGWKSRFRHYLNLERTEGKVRHLLENFHFAAAKDVLQTVRMAQPELGSLPLNLAADGD